MQTRRIVACSLIIVAGACIVSAQSLAKARSTANVAAIVKKDEKKPRPPKEAVVGAVDEGYIDWSYLQRNNPALVGAMVERVRKGEAGIASLGGLAATDKLKEYVSGGAKPQPPPAPGASKPAGGLGKSGVLTRPNAGLLGAITTKPSTVSATKFLIPLDVSPKKSDFGSVVDGQAVRKAIYLRNAPEGVLTASIAGKSPFRILNVKVMEGRFAMSRPGAWTESLVGTFAAEVSGIPGQSNSSSGLTRPRLDPSLTRKSGATGSSLRESALLKPSESVVSTLAKLRSEATAAPFEVDAPEGAMVRVIVEFRPKFNIFSGDPVGRHEATLNLVGGSQSANVKLAAFFEGVNLGVLAIPQDREYTLFAIRKEERHFSGGNMVTAHQKLRCSFNVTYLNPKSEARVGYEVVELPPGVRMVSGGSLTVPNGRSEGMLGFEIDFWGDDRGAQFGMGQEILLKFHSPAGARYLSLTVNLLPSMRKYSARGSVDDVFYDITMAAFEDGSLNCDFSFRTTNAWPTDAEFKFSIDGVQFVHYSTIWMNDGNKMKTSGSPKFKSQALADEWQRFVQKGASFWIKVTEKFRL